MKKLLQWIEPLLSASLYVIPHHLITRMTWRLSRVETRWVSAPLIRWFAKLFQINIVEAEPSELEKYPSLNAFFTRALKAGARPLPEALDQLVSPCDGVISEFGRIQHDQLIQAKGFYYDLNSLFAGETALSNHFLGGEFATIYLSPQDYHRIHMPYGGQLTEMLYVPGRLFSVSPATTRHIPNIFTRNERLISLFETDFGKIAVIMVGAINVSAIDTVWAPAITPNTAKKPQLTQFDQGLQLTRGDEMGRFNMGSTVVLLMEKSRIQWLNALQKGQKLQLNQGIARIV